MGPGYHGMASAPGAPAYFGPAAIGPPGTLRGLGWEPEILFIPEAVPLPGRQLRQRRGVQVGPAIPVQPPRRG